MARAALLIPVGSASARSKAFGCGRDRTLSEASRSGYLSAMPQAILPPQSWPTR